MKKTYRDEIRAIVMERGIEYLLHFTQAANLPGIIQHGLLSRRDLETLKRPALYSDQHRWDENDKAVSVSITRTNVAMFITKRQASGHENWVVLALAADILWTHDCLFAWCNAATNEIRDCRWFRGGPFAFAKMFEGTDETRSGLPPCCPTDPQAEVQVLQPISPDFILGAIVDRQSMVSPVEELLNLLPGGRRAVEIAVG